MGRNGVCLDNEIGKNDVWLSAELEQNEVYQMGDDLTGNDA